MPRLNRLLLVVPLLLAAFTLAGLAQGPGVYTERQLSREIAVQEARTAALFRNPDVVGVAVGATNRGRGRIQVYLRSGIGAPNLPRNIDGIPVVTTVTGEIRALKGKPPKPGNGVDPTARFDRPVPIGVSTGHPDITAGTIGCRVTDGSNVYALSNNHVYADENSAGIGDAVIQPGRVDGGSSPDDDIGSLADFEPIVFGFSANNVMDAAIASTTTSLLGNSTPSDGYGTPESSTVSAAVNMRVMKYGRTTGQTKGRITGINATVNVGYDSGAARFVDQIVIGRGGFSAGGDSGSCVVVEKGGDKRKVVGLLYAGSSNSTILNPIDPILTRFGVTIDGD